MFFIKGNRTVRIKRYRVHDRQCTSCNDFDLTVKIYKDYFHIWFIPIVASGVKSTKIVCNSCGSPMRSDSLAKEYESRTRIPFYLYTGAILAGAIVVGGLGLSLWGSYERSAQIARPAIGDVYVIKTTQPFTAYHFTKVMRISGDSVITWDNHVNYLSLDNAPSRLDSTDYFSAEGERGFTKSLLKTMYDRDSIVNVYRDEDEEKGFNRIR